MVGLGKYLLIGGLVLAFIGALVLLLSKAGLPLGNLPGDINLKRGDGSFHFPIVTCVILSIVFTVVVNIVLRFFK